MKEKPRDAKEGIFAKGGMRQTIFYGAVITVAVLIGYFATAWLNGVAGLGNIKAFYNDPANIEYYRQAQVMAFTTLAVCELFHMVGMSNLNRSFFHVFKNNNWMMIVAFVAGLALQLFVISVPGVQDVFSTTALSWQEWLITIALSVSPLLIHEVVIFVKFLIRKFSKKEN